MPSSCPQDFLLTGLSLLLLVLEVLGLPVLPLGLELQLLLLGYEGGLQFAQSLVKETAGQHVPLPNTLLGPNVLQVMRGPVLVAPGSRLGQLGNTALAIQLCLKGARLWPELTHVLQGAHLLRSFIIPQHAPTTTFML